MKIWLPKNQEELKEYLRDPLYKNSFFIMLTSISNAGFGFFFWMLAAKLYPKEMKSFTTISSINRLRLSSPIAKPIISEEEIKAIEEALRSGMLAHGEVVIRFENDFSEYRGCPPKIIITTDT